MTTTNSSGGNNGGGITFLGLLAIAFIVLKLTKVVSWSWVWVLSPLWIPAVIIVAAAVIIVWWEERK